MIHLQDRDIKLLSLCHEQRFLLLDHVGESFFASVSARRVRERVLELQKSNYIKRVKVPELAPKSLIVLSQKGVNFLRQNYPEIYKPVRARKFGENYVHDSIVTSVRIRLSKIWIGVWLSESFLKENSYQEVPDGVVAFLNKRHVAIEVENSKKGKARFIQLIQRWKLQNIYLVLYIATNEDIYETLKRYISEIDIEKPLIGLVRWQELKNSLPPVWTTKGNIFPFERSIL